MKKLRNLKSIKTSKKTVVLTKSQQAKVKGGGTNIIIDVNDI